MLLSGQPVKYVDNIYNAHFLLFPQEKPQKLFNQLLQKVLKGC